MGGCAPGKDCCDDCRGEVHQTEPRDAGAESPAPLVVWGPISDEVPSRDNPPKLIRLDAIEEALPQIIRRGTVDVNHKTEFVVAKVHPVVQVDVGRCPPQHQRMVSEVTGEYGGLPTAMVKVTQAIAEAFPRIAHRVGERLPFAASVLYDDNRTARRARQDVLEGRLDSYSLAGAAYGARYAKHCDPDGCQVVQEIPSMDGSSLTLTSYEKQTNLAGESRAANPGAGFVVVQQAQTSVERLKDAAGGVRVVDQPPPNASVVESAAPATSPATEPGASGASAGLVAVPAAEAVAVAQTTPSPSTGAQAAAPESVKQEEAMAPKVDVEAVIAQLVKRLTDLETEVALLKGRKEEAPTPAPAKEAEAKDEEGDEKPGEKKEDAEPVKEATALKQTIPTPAAPEAAGTPTPSSPGTPGPDPVAQAIFRDMDNGDPSALKRLRTTFGGRKA